MWAGAAVMEQPCLQRCSRWGPCISAADMESLVLAQSVERNSKCAVTGMHCHEMQAEVPSRWGTCTAPIQIVSLPDRRLPCQGRCLHALTFPLPLEVGGRLGRGLTMRGLPDELCIKHMFTGTGHRVRSCLWWSVHLLMAWPVARRQTTCCSRESNMVNFVKFMSPLAATAVCRLCSRNHTLLEGGLSPLTTRATISLMARPRPPPSRCLCWWQSRCSMP